MILGGSKSSVELSVIGYTGSYHGCCKWWKKLVHKEVKAFGTLDIIIFAFVVLEDDFKVTRTCRLDQIKMHIF